MAPRAQEVESLPVAVFLQVFNTCNGAAPRLSSPVQNAPGGGVIRGQDDFTHFGQVAEYSNAEASIITAFLLLDLTTSTSAIAESNLETGSIAGASTGVQSNTQLDLDIRGWWGRRKF